MLLSKFIAAHLEDSDTQLLRLLPGPVLLEEGGLSSSALDRHVHYLEDNVASVGRSSRRDLVVPAAGVSSRHAEFRRAGDHWELVDLGSTNGTFLDGRRLASGTPSPVPFQSVVEFASARFAFMSPARFLETVRRAQLASGQYQCLIPTSTFATPPREDISEETIPIKLPSRTKRGEIAEIQVLDLLRRLEACQHSGRLAIKSANGTRGWISFRVGLPWDARASDGLTGVKAVLGLLKIDDGEFYVQEANIPEGRRKITLALSDILLSAERKRSKAAAALSEAQLRATFETAFHGMLVCSATGHVLVANRRCEEMFGRAVDDLSGLHVDQLLCDGSDLLTLRNTARTREADGRRGTGARFPLEVSLSQFEIDGTTTWTLALQDISERKKAERALAEANAALEHSQRMEALGRLVAGITHDFKNVLCPILGYSELLVSALEPGQSTRRWAEAIGKAANQGSVLAQQLLATASPAEPATPTATDLADVFGEMELLLKPVLGEDIELRLPSGPDLGLVLIDRSQLERVIMNLVVNARDATEGQGRIVLSTAKVSLDDTRPPALRQLAPGSYVRLTVADTGSGMDPETVEKAFEPFFTTKGRDQGTGLGLSVVYGVIKQCGGLITVESELGQGTTFTAFLPAEPGR